MAVFGNYRDTETYIFCRRVRITCNSGSFECVQDINTEKFLLSKESDVAKNAALAAARNLECVKSKVLPGIADQSARDRLLDTAISQARVACGSFLRLAPSTDPAYAAFKAIYDALPTAS